jgi:hypothetical protein
MRPKKPPSKANLEDKNKKHQMAIEASIFFEI